MAGQLALLNDQTSIPAVVIMAQPVVQNLLVLFHYQQYGISTNGHQTNAWAVRHKGQARPTNSKTDGTDREFLAGKWSGPSQK